MSVLTIPEIVALARKHGFTGAEVPDFAAVVMTESGGKTDAVQKGGLGRGLVQIDLGQHPKVTQAQAFDPDFAAAFARKLSRNKSGLGPTNWYGPRDRPAVAAQARSDARKVMMNFVSRSEWGARSAPNVSTNITPSRTLVHWVGPGMGTPSHDRCAGSVRGIQRYHMDSNGWADIAYSLLVCNHGWVYEGRGLGKRTAANGTNSANQNAYAVCYLGGVGDPLTDLAKEGINDAIDYLGQSEVGGHRDATDTECPGDELYEWVQAGHPRPNSTQVPEPTPTPTPCEQKVFGLGDEDRCVIYIQRLLNKRGNTLVDDGDFGPRTEKAVKRFQKKVKLTPDGVVGPETWAALWNGVSL